MKIFLTCIVLTYSLFSYSQRTVTGKITDAKGKPIAFSNIYIKGTYDGTTSDMEGNFKLSTSKSDSMLLVVSFIGYENKEYLLSDDTGFINLQIKLKPDFTKLADVVITASVFEASDEKKSVALKPMDIVTTAGGAADIYETLKLLPGSQQVGEQEGLFVRGGSAAETVTIIDEMVVKNPFYSSVPDVPQRSRFQPFLFKGTLFSTGGYSAVYGQAMSSALILNTTDLVDSNVSGAGIHMAGVNAFHAQRFKKSSASVNLEYNNLEPYFRVIDQETEWIEAPKSYNTELAFRHKFTDNDIFKLYMLGSKSNLSMRYDNLNNDSIFKSLFDLNNENIYVNAGYKVFLNKELSLFAGTSFSNSKDDFTENTFDLQNSERDLQFKTILTKYFNKSSNLKTGFEAQFNQNSVKLPYFAGNLHDNYYAGFAELNLRLGTRIAARYGVRALTGTFSNDKRIAPRVSLTYLTGINSQVSLAYGSFYQMPEDSLLFRFNDSQFERADHYILNYQWTGDDRILRIEAYNKQYSNLLFQPNEFYADYSGGGYAQGIDAFWRDEKTFTNSDYWISYSYIDTKRKYRRYSEKVKPSFVSDHNVSVVYKYTFPKIMTTMGASYSYASGRSFYVFGDELRLSDNTPDYHNLSISASKVGTVFGNFAVFYAALYNVFNRKNVFAYRYSPNGQNKIEIGAPSLRSFFVGCFIAID